MLFKNYLKKTFLTLSFIFLILFSAKSQSWVEMNVQQNVNNIEMHENASFVTELCPSSSFIRINPNPASNFIYVSIDPVKECIATISILNERGEAYMNHSIEMNDAAKMGRINISGLEKGMYFFRIITPWGYETRKFLKH